MPARQVTKGCSQGEYQISKNSRERTEPPLAFQSQKVDPPQTRSLLLETPENGKLYNTLLPSRAKEFGLYWMAARCKNSGSWKQKKQNKKKTEREDNVTEKDGLNATLKFTNKGASPNNQG